MTVLEDTYSNRALRRRFRAIQACAAGRDWVGNRDMRTAWAECPRGDWMLQAAEGVGVDRRFVVRTAAHCIQQAVAAHVPAGETRPQQALDAALTWARDPTAENLRAAEAAADRARASAAEAAAGAADADAAEAYAAALAASSLLSNPEAALADVAYIDDEAHQHHADIVRGLIPFAIVAGAIDARRPKESTSC